MMEPDTMRDVLSHYTTRTRQVMERLINREGKVLDIERRFRDMYVEHDRRLQKIEENTEPIPWLSKLIANVFKFGGSQSEQKYPSKKK